LLCSLARALWSVRGFCGRDPRHVCSTAEDARLHRVHSEAAMTRKNARLTSMRNGWRMSNAARQEPPRSIAQKADGAWLAPIAFSALPLHLKPVELHPRAAEDSKRCSSPRGRRPVKGLRCGGRNPRLGRLSWTAESRSRPPSRRLRSSPRAPPQETIRPADCPVYRGASFASRSGGRVASHNFMMSACASYRGIASRPHASRSWIAARLDSAAPGEVQVSHACVRIAAGRERCPVSIATFRTAMLRGPAAS